MTERESLLTESEQRALAVHEDLPRARAIQAWMTYAALQNFETDRLVVGIEEIRNMSGKRLKRVRKDLVAATRLLDDMVAASYEESIQAEGCIPGEEYDGVVELTVATDDEQQATPFEVPMIDTVVEQLSEAVLEPAAEIEQEDTRPSVLTVELPEQSREWVAKIMPGYEFGNKAISEVAHDIYAKMGEPKTRHAGGKKIDPLERITQRLMGESNAEIAQRDDVSLSAVNQWFRNFVEKKLLSVEPSIEEEQAAETPVPTPLRMKQRQIEIAEPIVADYKELVATWASETGLMAGEIEALYEVLDPDFSLEMNGVHKQVRHRFRLYLASKLPNLESDELGLTSNEIARLGRLLGREKTSEGFSYTAAPQSAHEISMDHGYFVPQNRNELLSALQKVAQYIFSQNDAVELSEAASGIHQLLLAAEFSQKEADALLAYITIGEDGKHGERTPDAAEALKRLQRILAQKRHKITDQEITAPGLTMLTNVAFGNKTINDVYYKVHGKDPQITRQEVSERIIKGIEELVA